MLLIIGGVLGVVDSFTDIQIDDAFYLKHCSNTGTFTVQWNGTVYTHENHGFCVTNGSYMAVLGVILAVWMAELVAYIWGQFQIREYWCLMDLRNSFPPLVISRRFVRCP